jgi:hypothetical protein
MEYILIAGAIYLAFKAGVIWHRHYFAFLIAQHPEHLDRLLKLAKEGKLEAIQLSQVSEEVETQEDTGTELAIERVGDVLYAYAKETGQFIAQGASLTILLAEAEKRFPNRKFFGNITKDNPAKELA